MRICVIMLIVLYVTDATATRNIVYVACVLLRRVVVLIGFDVSTLFLLMHVFVVGVSAVVRIN